MENINNFYTLGSKLSSSTFHVCPVGLSNKRDESNKFDEHRLILGEYHSISFPVQFKHTNGSKLLDILDTGWPSLYLISSKMRHILKEHQLTGWQTFEVNVFDKQNNPVFGYYGLSITGRCGQIDYSKSKIVKKKIVSEGSMCNFYKGLYVGLDEWDGKDFFIPNGNFGIIISTKASKCILNSKLSNIVLENLSAVETLTR